MPTAALSTAELSALGEGRKAPVSLSRAPGMILLNPVALPMALPTLLRPSARPRIPPAAGPQR